MSTFYRNHLIDNKHQINLATLSFIIMPWRYRKLIAQLSQRDIAMKYRGSLVGLIWLIIEPLIMLAIYTLFLGSFLQARWSQSMSNQPLKLALTLFIGLNFYHFFAECLNKAPYLIRNNINYVKKIIFPLEILPWIAMMSSLVYILIAFLIWSIFYVVTIGILPITSVCLVLLMIPFMLLTLGCIYFISSLSVYIKDIGNILTFAMTALMFLSPIFYRLDTMSPTMQYYLQLNPLAFVIEQARGCLLDGRWLAWQAYGRFCLVSFSLALAGYYWFQKTKEGFADVL